MALDNMVMHENPQNLLRVLLQLL